MPSGADSGGGAGSAAPGGPAGGAAAGAGPAAGRETAGPGDGAACGRGRDGDAGAGIPGGNPRGGNPWGGDPLGRGPRAGHGSLLPPGLAGRYWRQGRGRGRLLQGRLQAPVGHPERVAALLQLPGQLVDLRVPQRGQLLPGLGRERGEEVRLGEQQVLGVVQGQPEPGIPGQRDQRQVDDQAGEGVEPAVPVVVQGVLVVRVAVLGGRGLPGQLRNPDPVEVDQPELPVLVHHDVAVLQVAVGELAPLEQRDQLAPPARQRGQGGGVGPGYQEVHVLVERPAVDPVHGQHRPGRPVDGDRPVEPGGAGHVRAQVVTGQVGVQRAVPVPAGGVFPDVAAQGLGPALHRGLEHHGAAAPGQRRPEAVPDELGGLELGHGEAAAGRLYRLVVVAGGGEGVHRHASR